MSAHPELAELERLARGEPAVPELEAHVSGCSECADRLEELRANAALLDELRAEKPLPPDLAAGTDTVPGYRVLGEIHRGGQGIVYEAVQEATRRTVALKVLLDGSFASPARLRRFEREIELIASLRHPGVVTVFDSGRTRDGRPFFTMERIEGEALDAYAARRLPRDLGGRLALFAEVCEAVAYAHRRGVIHRDLKPGNVLVDAEGHPHVVDFGLAKVLVPDGNAARRLTASNEFLGTLAYASPEQLAGEPDAIDVRTDVYSLGVMLYELLAGRSPHGDSERVADLVRAISDSRPLPPSARSRAALAPAGGSAGGVPRVDRDLDTLVLHALAKEPDRRYQSAGELARDLHRYLDGLPLDARRDSTWYVLRKTLARHRLRVGVAAAFVLTVAVASVMLAVLWRASVESEQRALRESRWSRTTLDLFRDVLTSVDPSRSRGRNLTVREVLDETAARAGQELAGEPLLEAELHAMLGEAFQSLEMRTEARAHLEQALALRRAAHPGPHLDVAESLRLLAACARDDRRLDDAQELDEEELALLDELGPEADEERARCLGDLSLVCLLAGEEDRARALWSSSMDVARRTFGPDHEAIATAWSRLGGLHLARSEYAQGIGALEEAVAMRARLGRGEHLDQTWDLMNLAEARAALGREAEARADLLEAQRSLVLLLGEDHPGSILCQARLALVATRTVGPEPAQEEIRLALEREPALAGRSHAAVPAALDVLGLLARSTGDLLRAEELFRSSLDASERLLLDRTPGAAVARTNLAAVLGGRGRHAEAAELCRQAIEILHERPGGDSSALVDALLLLAFQFQDEGDLAGAEERAREAFDTAQRLFAPPHPTLVRAEHGLGWIVFLNGDAERAAELLGEALERQLELQPEPDPECANLRTKLGTVLAELGELDRAVEELRAGLAAREELYGTLHPALVDSRLSLGSVLRRRGELEEARAQLEDALDASRLLYGDHSSTIRCLNELAELNFRASRFEEALELMQESIDVSRRALPPRSTGLAYNLYNAVRALGPLGRVEEAEPLLEESLDIYLERLGPDHERTRAVRAELENVRRLLGRRSNGGPP